MKRLKNNICIACIVLGALGLILSGCENSLLQPPVEPEPESESGTLTITVPSLAPVLQEKAGRDASASAFLGADIVYVELRDAGDIVIDSAYVDNQLNDPAVTFYDNSMGYGVAKMEDVPPGYGYMLYSYIENVNVEGYTTGTYTVTGTYGPFQILANTTNHAVIINTPANPTALTDGSWSQIYTTATHGENWFSVTTGASDSGLYIQTDSYANSNPLGYDADFDLFVYDDQGFLIGYSYEFSDGDPNTPESESLAIETYRPVLPNTTYYIGVYAWVGGDFDVWVDSY